jgi:hypothetical protein
MRDIKPIRMLWQFMLLSLLVFFAGCKQGALVTQLGSGNELIGTPCENRSGGINPAFLDVYCVTDFDQVAVNLARDAVEFAVQQFEWVFTGIPGKYSSFSFRAVRTEFAHSVGLSGKGETIAIVDTGFYTNHPELDGKPITLYGLKRPTDDHGTSVAAIAAGINDGSGMMGVAYDASLHLTSLSNSLSVIADATDHARQNGAIVQNNSWGYPDTSIDNVLNRPAGMIAEQAFANEIDVSLSVATSYTGALINFAQAGIVVFSNSNDETATSLGLMEALPLAFPQLESGWITALNGVPTFNDAGEITEAVRLSAECFEMAPSCLMAEGAVYATSDASSYTYPIVGTSFAAPIISGGIAILAEAFPSLDGPEIRNRLLVTADNSFFTPEDFSQFADILHGYSSEYGHGFMNLEAALLPIGTVGVPTGLSVSDGTMSIQEASVATGFAQGDAVITALSNVDVMVIDSLSGNFNVPAKTFVISTNTQNYFQEFALFVDDGKTQSGISGALKSLAFVFDADSNAHIVGGSTFDVISDIGLVPERAGLLYDPITMAEVPADSYSLGMQAPIDGHNELAAYVYSSSEWALSSALGAGVALQFGPKSSRLSLGASIMQEQGAALGMQSLAADQSLSSVSRAIDVGYSASLDKNITFDANAQIGAVTSSGQGMWGGQEGTTFSAYGMALNVTNVFAGNDRIIASVRQPIAIDGGSMSVALPQTRDIDGNITSSVFDISLAPSDRQLDLGLEYEVSLDQFESIRFGAAYILNSANVTGETSLGLAMSYSLEF